MKLLAIETAFETCSVALWVDGESLERFELTPRAHAGALLPWVEELLEEAGLGLAGLDAIAFSRGPGSFTSLRIGISVVQGLAWGAQLPVVPVSSLRVTAQAAVAEGVERALVAMDARMNEVFCARFEQRGGLMHASGKEWVGSADEAIAGGLAGWSGVGNGFERFAALAGAAEELESVHARVWPRAISLAELASDWLASHSPLRAELAQPVYIRDKVADKPAPG